MRRFTALAAGVLVALSALTLSTGTANAEGGDNLIILPRPAAPSSPNPPVPPKGVWTFTANYASLQTCQLDGQQYVRLVPQDKLARCQLSTNASFPGVYDLWLLYVLPHTGQ